MSALAENEVPGLGWVFTTVTGGDPDVGYRLGRIREHLDYLEAAWPDVLDLKEPSNRLVSVRALPPDAAARARAAALVELAESRLPGAVTPPGERPAPVNVTALDLLSEIVGAAQYVASWVARVATMSDLGAMPSAYLDPRPRLLLARAWLSAAAEEDPGTVPEVERLLAGVAGRAASFLGDVLDGQVLDAVCPWCEGRTEHAPLGGERTLRVVAPGARRRGVAAEPPLLVCLGLNCEPGPQYCGSRYQCQPAWPEWEWQWLEPLLVAYRGDVPAVAASPAPAPPPEPRELRFSMTYQRTRLLTANDRPHHMKRHRLSTSLRAESKYHALGAMGQERLRFERAEVWVHLAYPDRRRRDDHNLMPSVKAMVDGFVDAGLLPDDDRKHLRGPWLEGVDELSGDKQTIRFDVVVREILKEKS